MTLKLTYEQAKADLEALAAERPDYVYEAPEKEEEDEAPICMYFHENAPSCIVGHVMARHGMTQDQLTSFENAGTAVYGLFANDTLQVDRKTGVMLSRAQAMQDQGSTWGDSVAEAIEYDPDGALNQDYGFRA